MPVRVRRRAVPTFAERRDRREPRAESQERARGEIVVIATEWALGLYRCHPAQALHSKIVPLYLPNLRSG